MQELIKTLRKAASCQPNNADLFSHAANEIERLDLELEKEITIRDQYHEWADEVSFEVARFMCADIGEHTSANNPWLNAFECIPESDINKIKAESFKDGFEHGYHYASEGSYPDMTYQENVDAAYQECLFDDKLERGEL